jgi:hypothetical protein
MYDAQQKRASSFRCKGVTGATLVVGKPNADDDNSEAVDDAGVRVAAKAPSGGGNTAELTAATPSPAPMPAMAKLLAKSGKLMSAAAWTFSARNVVGDLAVATAVATFIPVAVRGGDKVNVLVKWVACEVEVSCMANAVSRRLRRSSMMRCLLCSCASSAWKQNTKNQTRMKIKNTGKYTHRQCFTSENMYIACYTLDQTTKLVMAKGR